MKKLYAILQSYAEDMIKMEDQVQFLQTDQAAINVYKAYGNDDDEDEENKPYKVVNGTALYSIKGKMLSSGNWVTEWLGIPTYDGISDALSQMVQDESVEQILIAMDTPGGVVSGISDVAEAWRRVNAVKPITVHSGGTLGSAGIWLASNSDKIYASETADVGSIGVIMQHMSYQAMLTKEGIKVTEIKSAPDKAVGSPAKDLSDHDREYLQKKVMESDSLFKAQIYRSRPAVSANAFTGGTFSATECMSLGLIDGVMSYSRVFEQLSASAGSQDKNSYTEENGMKKRYVTAAMAEAAITAGADPDNLEILTQEAYDALSDEDKSVEEEVASDEGAETEAVDASTLELEAQVENLGRELASVNGQVETLTAQVTDLTVKLEAAKTDPLRIIAEERLGVMRVALGLTTVDFKDFSAQALVTEYQAIDAQFKKNFKPGGHKPTQKTETKKTAVITSIDQARLAATGL